MLFHTRQVYQVPGRKLTEANLNHTSFSYFLIVTCISKGDRVNSRVFAVAVPTDRERASMVLLHIKCPLTCRIIASGEESEY